jgi:MFS family permease
VSSPDPTVATTGPTGATRGPVAATFIALGAFWGTWAVSVADIQRTFALSDAQLGLLLSVAIGIAAMTGAVVGHRAERWGTGRLLTWALVVWALFLVGAALARAWIPFAALFVAAEVSGGCVDTAMNAAASARLMGRPGALVRFHALFNIGALSGAAAAGVVLHAGLSWRWLWPALALGAGGIALWAHLRAARPVPAGSAMLRTHSPEGTGPGGTGPEATGTLGPLARLRADRLLMFLFIFAVAEITEGGVDTWGVLYLRTHLAAGVLLGAGAYVVGQSVAATTRGAGGPMLGLLTARMGLVAGGLLACGGILLESLSVVPAVAAVGLALGAAGASLFWPLVMSQATQQASQPTAASGAFTAAGYVGWVAGAPLVGWVSDAFGPARGLQLLAAMAAVVVIAALLLRDGGPRRSVTG